MAVLASLQEPLRRVGRLQIRQTLLTLFITDYGIDSLASTQNPESQFSLIGTEQQSRLGEGRVTADNLVNVDFIDP